jgi:hypothetical protein
LGLADVLGDPEARRGVFERPVRDRGALAAEDREVLGALLLVVDAVGAEGPAFAAVVLLGYPKPGAVIVVALIDLVREGCFEGGGGGTVPESLAQLATCFNCRGVVLSLVDEDGAGTGQRSVRAKVRFLFSSKVKDSLTFQIVVGQDGETSSGRLCLG